MVPAEERKEGRESSLLEFLSELQPSLMQFSCNKIQYQASTNKEPNP
jgi:hypothetical protein